MNDYTKLTVHLLQKRLDELWKLSLQIFTKNILNRKPNISIALQGDCQRLYSFDEINFCGSSMFLFDILGVFLAS